MGWGAVLGVFPVLGGTFWLKTAQNAARFFLWVFPAKRCLSFRVRPEVRVFNCIILLEASAFPNSHDGWFCSFARNNGTVYAFCTLFSPL